MALIKCSECGKEISDRASVCIHCGCPLIISEIKEDNLPKVVKGKRKKLIMYIVIICILLVVASSLFIVSNPNIKMSVKCGKELKKSLRNPSSLHLTGDLIKYEFSKSFEKGEYVYYVLYYRAENGYGGQEKNVAVYNKEGEYLGDKSADKIYRDKFYSDNEDEDGDKYGGIGEEMFQFCYCLDRCKEFKQEKVSKFILSILIPCKID